MNKLSTRTREFFSTDGLTVFGILGLTIFMVLLTTMLVFTDQHNGRENQQKYDAILAGVIHAKEKCMDDKLSADICNSITGEASKSSCTAAKCWMIYAHSSKSEYIATMIVEQPENTSKLTVTNYRRDTSDR